LKYGFNLETSVGRGKDMQDIGAHGESEKLVVTLLVMRCFSDLPGAPRACMDFRDPTDVSRFNRCNGYYKPLKLVCTAGYNFNES